MNEYECDMMDLEKDVESLHEDLDRLDSLVTEMSDRLDAIIEDLEEALCDGCPEGCCEEPEVEEE